MDFPASYYSTPEGNRAPSGAAVRYSPPALVVPRRLLFSETQDGDNNDEEADDEAAEDDAEDEAAEDDAEDYYLEALAAGLTGSAEWRIPSPPQQQQQSQRSRVTPIAAAADPELLNAMYSESSTPEEEAPVHVVSPPVQADAADAADDDLGVMAFQMFSEEEADLL